MRLFIAIDFEDKIKDFLQQTVLELHTLGIAGNFTRQDNFHLTLNFIGETREISAIKEIMDRATVPPVSFGLK